MGKCKDCYYYGKCCSNEDCEYFTPIHEDFSEEEAEDTRQEYHEAWFEYISDDE